MSEEERLFQIMHDALFAYINHLVDDSDRAEKIYQLVVDVLIDLTD